MKSLPIWFAALLATGMFSWGEPPALAMGQESDAPASFEVENDPLEADGPLKKIGDAQDLFELKSVGTKLEAESVAGYQQAQGSVSQIRSQTRSGGGSSSSGNGNWMAYFQGGDFSGYVSSGAMAAHMMARFPNMKTGTSDSDFTIEFQELKSPQRELLIGANEDSVFDISLRSSELGYLFRFRQEKGGRVVCQEICSDFVFARSASSFDQFSKQNPDYARERLMRVFEFIGVGKPTTRFSPVVRNQVLRMLRPIGEERRTQFKNAIAKMSASSFKEREAATAEIEKKFQQWQDLIEISMVDESFEIETRTRLRKIYGNHVDETIKQLMELAQSSKLHSDPEYLVWALGKTDDENDKTILAQQLAKLTKEDFELDVDKWNAWFVEQNKKDEDSAEKTNELKPGQQTGPMDSVTQFIQQLVKFKTIDGELQLDRKHWGQPFNDRPTEESVAEVKELMRKHNLPLEWLDAGGDFTLDSTGYPQMIFANMAAQLESEDKQETPQQRTYGYINQADPATRNRFVNTSQISAQLQFHQETGNAFVVGNGNPNPPPERYFHLHFKEQTGAKRILEIHESENKTISITLISDDVDTLIRLVQHPANDPAIPADRRCVIFDIRGNQATQRKAKSFAELFRDNTEYLKNEWLPLMEGMGIQIETSTAESE